MSCQCNQPKGACATEFQYAVKVVCGEAVSLDNVPTPVAPGRYWTAINIHNPTKCQDAHFRWKVAVANPGQPGPVTAYSRPLTLRPDEALEIDCPQVMRALAQPPPRFVKGYAVFESDIELDVVAVYSGTPGPCGSNTFHTERVQARCVPVCEDLVLPLNTGFAAWQTVLPTPGFVGPVALVTPPGGGWAAAPFGSSWVSQLSTDGGNAPTTTRTYELCFDLCSGFTPPGLFSIQALADGGGQVSLNNFTVGNVPNWTNPATLVVNPNFFRAGRNCFRILVVNGGQANNPTGFAFAGTLNIAKGKCPCSALPIAAPRPGPAGLTDFETQSAEPPADG